jgi:hypothetical protein
VGLDDDVDGMNKEWSTKNHNLYFQLNSVVLPFGSLWILLPGHRSLLFKVSDLTSCTMFMIYLIIIL